MARKYFILVGKFGNKNAPFEMLFGDYEKDVVTDEKDDTSDEYKCLRVVTLLADTDAAVIEKMNELNG